MSHRAVGSPLFREPDQDVGSQESGVKAWGLPVGPQFVICQTGVLLILAGCRVGSVGSALCDLEALNKSWCFHRAAGTNQAL